MVSIFFFFVLCVSVVFAFLDFGFILGIRNNKVSFHLRRYKGEKEDIERKREGEGYLWICIRRVFGIGRLGDLGQVLPFLSPLCFGLLRERREMDEENCDLMSRRERRKV